MADISGADPQHNLIFAQRTLELWETRRKRNPDSELALARGDEIFKEVHLLSKVDADLSKSFWSIYSDYMLHFGEKEKGKKVPY